MLKCRGRQIAARGPNVASHSVFSGPQKHSGKSSNLIFPPVSRININATIDLEPKIRHRATIDLEPKIRTAEVNFILVHKRKQLLLFARLTSDSMFGSDMGKCRPGASRKVPLPTTGYSFFSPKVPPRGIAPRPPRLSGPCICLFTSGTVCFSNVLFSTSFL